MQTFSTGLVVSIIGFFSSFPIFLAGLKAMGADDTLAASGLMAASVAMGVTSVVLSLWSRIPASAAWSTPGIAVLIVSPLPEGGFASAVACFAAAGALVFLAGLFRPLARLAAMIPTPLAQAMLAGVLLPICSGPVLAIGLAPLTAFVLLGTWVGTRMINRLLAVPATVLAAAVLTFWNAGGTIPLTGPVLTVPTVTVPVLNLADLLSIGLPLFLITMATQNVPGVVVLRAYGYVPPARRMFASVGAASVLTAPFGSPSTCLAAMTAAMCAGADSHPDPARRYMSSVWVGIFYSLMGLFAGIITQFATHAPPQTLELLAGIALFSVFVQSLSGAFADDGHREASALTLVISASGVTILGLGGAVWGLLIGGIAWAALSRKTRTP